MSALAKILAGAIGRRWLSATLLLFAVMAMSASAPTLERAIALIRSGEESAVKPFLQELGSQLLPLLNLLEREMVLGLPLDVINQRLVGAPRINDSAGDPLGKLEETPKHID